MMTLTRLIALAAAMLLGACSQEEPTPAAPEQPSSTDVAAEEAPPSLPRTASPEGARVFFISPEDGETLSNPVKIEFGIDGMSVVPAGVNETHSGHHHLIVDASLPENMGLPIPANDNYIHFGDASTSTEITLEPGQHTLQLLLGDHLHVPHDPPIASEIITITVE